MGSRRHLRVPTLLVPLFSLLVPFVAAAQAPDSTADARPADSTRVVRTLEPTLVRASRLDVMSSAVRLRLGRESLRALPVDRVADALALQPGVVVDGEFVHVRGGRPGELRIELDGIALNEPLRGRPIDLPLIALDEVELITGGLEAEYGGGLAGTLVARPATAGDRWRGRLLWQTDGRRSTHSDRAGARASGPIGLGLGLSAGAEARLDDTNVPNQRTLERTRVLGRSFGWRADNRLSALVRLAPVREPARLAIQALVHRKLLRPWQPMFSLVGWTTPCPDDTCLRGPAYSPTEIVGRRYAPYNAADHVPVTDVRRAALIVSSQRLVHGSRARVAMGWNAERRVTSLDGTEDERYLAPGRKLLYGLSEDPTSDPFHVYGGDTPYFRKTTASWFEGRADFHRELESGGGFGAGVGFTHEHVTSRELDLAFAGSGFDSTRLFVATAPGANAWIQGRWVSAGLVAQGGLRAEYYTPGADAASTLHSDPVRDHFALSPRVGLSFPLSAADAFQASYVRIVQPPGREFLYDGRTGRINPEHPLGNPALLPATSVAWEFVLKHVIGPEWAGRAGLFSRDLFRQVSARDWFVRSGPSLNGTHRLRYSSDDAGRAFGFELAFERDVPARSHVGVSYTWMHTEGSESFEDGVPIYPLRVAQPVAISERPLTWDQPHRFALRALRTGPVATLSWTTVVASGLPWTPAGRRTAPADLSRVNSRRLPATMLSDLSARWMTPRRCGALAIGLEVRNVFDFRGQRRVSMDGYPNPVINTQYDDYAAHFEETGLGGGAFWDDSNNDGLPGWTRVRDPRLDIPPRAVRLSLEREW